VDVTIVASDPDGNPITFNVVDAPDNGTLSGSGPSFTYVPNAGFSGTDAFRVRVNDGTVSSPVAGVLITVGTPNTAPVANDQSVTTSEDTAVPVTLTGSDVEGSPLSFTVVTPPAHGALSGTAPNLTYTPAPDYNGADSFTFRVNDGSLDGNVATVSITVDPVNDAPVAHDVLSVLTVEALPTDIALGATDPDGDALTFSIVTPPAHGVLSGTGPTVTYTSNAGYTGPDSFTFKANDGTVDSNVATVTISVRPPNTIATTTALQASATSVGALEWVRLTAIVSPVVPGTGVPGGDVEFVLNGTTVLGVGSLLGGVASITSNGGVSPGTYSITARYLGGTPFTASVSAPLSLIVRPLAQSSFTLLLPWTNPLALGSQAAVSALVVPLAGGATPTGTVEFISGSTIVGSAAISGGLATVVWTPPAAGTLTIYARYLGDAAFATSTSQPAMITVYSGAAPAATTTTFTVTPNQQTFGQPVTFTATVTGPVAPGGVVTFFADGNALGTGTVNNVGGVMRATFTTSALPFGVRVVSASFGGTPGFATSNAASAIVVITP